MTYVLKTLACIRTNRSANMAANGISTLSTKELRQKAKLDLASIKRAATGRRSEYDITQLPTQYYGDTVINNPNASGLIQGRPWITGSNDSKYENGLYSRGYTGYFNDVPSWFATATEYTHAVATSLEVPSYPTTTSLQALGYFVPRTTEMYTFYTTSDDASYLWVGDSAVVGFTTANSVVNNGGLHGGAERSGTIALTAGVYYPIRIQFGNNAVTGVLSVSYSTPTISKTTDFTDMIFYNADTNGL